MTHVERSARVVVGLGCIAAMKIGSCDYLPGRPRVLLADADRTDLGQPLARAGFEVRVVGSGAEARERLGGDSDLAVLDTSLFAGDVVSAIRAVRERGVAIPLLLLAGHAAEVAPALDAGADDVVVRPFAIVELVARCRALVRRARAPRWTPIR